MYNIDDDQLLFKSHQYMLSSTDKDKEKLNFMVGELIQGDSQIKYIAMPIEYPYNGKLADEKYWGTGNSEKEALNNCLDSIKGVSKSTLFS